MSASATPCPEVPSRGARPLEFDKLFAAERRHFWFRARNRVLGRLVGGLTAGLPDGYRVLEVGCGNGNVLAELERVCRRGEVVGSELFEEGLAYARRRVRCRLIRADVYDLRLTERFDVVGLFDVLEHLPDDRRALECLGRLLTPGGRLVLTVPAHRSLWSDVDVYAQHYRRYAPTELDSVLRAAGYRVEYRTQFMAALYPLMWLSRKVASWRRPGGGAAAGRDRLTAELKVVPVVNGLMNVLLACEAPLLARRWRLPLGTSLLAVATPAEGTAARAAA